MDHFSLSIGFGHIWQADHVHFLLILDLNMYPANRNQIKQTGTMLNLMSNLREWRKESKPSSLTSTYGSELLMSIQISLASANEQTYTSTQFPLVYFLFSHYYQYGNKRCKTLSLVSWWSMFSRKLWLLDIYTRTDTQTYKCWHVRLHLISHIFLDINALKI